MLLRPLSPQLSTAGLRAKWYSTYGWALLHYLPGVSDWARSAVTLLAGLCRAVHESAYLHTHEDISSIMYLGGPKA